MFQTCNLRITSVDHDGFNGREHHPVNSDIGLIVTPVKSEAWFFDEEGQLEPVYNEDRGTILPGMLPILSKDQNDDDASRIMWLHTCVTEDGRTIDLLDFEIEVI